MTRGRKNRLPGIAAISVLLVSTLASAQSDQQPATDQMPRLYGYRIVDTLPHDTDAYTQGLFVEDGVFYESTGLYGESTLRRVDIKTGDVIKKQKLPTRFFGEGIVAWNDKLIALTYRAGVGFVFDKHSFRRISTFRYDGEGWGLTHDGKHIIMSDGTSTLRRLNPETLEQIGTIDVTFLGRPVPLLNELEYINGEIYANVYQTSKIVRINPDTGKITGVIELDGILPRDKFVRGETDVLNGIAYDAQSARLFVTGKKWPHVYQIELTQDGDPATE